MLSDYSFRRITEFQGPWSLVDPTDVRHDRALSARNVRYTPGKVGSREGHLAAFEAGGGVTRMYNWVTSLWNALVYFESGQDVKIRFLSTASTYDPGEDTHNLFSLSGAHSISIAEAGKKAYITGFTRENLGVNQCWVEDAGTYLPYPIPAFLQPTQIVPAISESLLNASSLTPGTHLFAIVAISRSGFYTAPGVPVSVSVTGQKKIIVQMTGVHSPGTLGYAVLMTTSDNHDQWYFVPGAEAQVQLYPEGESYPFPQILVDISDAQLRASKTDLDATEQFLLLTRNSSGTMPFNPSIVIAYGKRMVYLADDTLYISDPGDYEHLTLDQNTQILPGKQQMLGAMVIRGLLYVFGPRWTYAFSDNDDRPATWAQPVEIDGQIGSLGPLAMTTDSTGSYGWVADKAGLYYFSGGAFPQLPVSFYQTPEWERINLAYAHTVQVVDDHVTQRVYVIAPLDSATAPSHILVWDYHEGREADKVHFSLDSIANYSIGSVAMVQHPTTKKLVRYIGPSAAGNVLSQDASSHSDGGTAIVSQYETALFPLENDRKDEINLIRAYSLRLQGSGTLNLTAHTLDHARSQALEAVTLSTGPGREVLRKLRHRTEQGSLELTQSALNAYWEMTRITPYWVPWGARVR